MTKMSPNSKTWYSENPSSEIGEIFCYFGGVLREYGQFFSAKGFYAASLEICEKDHDLYIMTKQYYEKALAIQTEQLGSNHVNVVTIRSNVLRREGNAFYCESIYL